MDLNYYSRLSYARIIAENNGLGLIEESIDMPRTDGTNIYVPIYNPMWDSDSSEAVSWWGKFLHEIYHNDKRYDHSKSFDILKKNKDSLTEMLKYASNLLEDHRIEKNEWGEYPGRDHTMSALRKKMYAECKEGLINNPTGNPKMDALYWLQWASFGTWMDDIGWIDFRSELNEDIQKYIGIVEKYIEPIYELDSAQACWDLSVKIVSELGDDSPKTKDKEKKKGTGEKGKEGEEDGSDEGKDGEDESVQADYGKFCEHDHESKEYREDAPPAKVKAKATGLKHTPAKMVELKATEITSDTPFNYVPYITSRISTEGLAAQIKRYLLVHTKSKSINNQKSGRIDTASLWKATVYRTASSGSRVFQKDTEHLNLDTAVSLIVDQSGSMHGERYFNAAAAAVILNEVFSRIGVKTRITSFTDDYTSTYNILHKDFGVKINKDILIKGFAEACSWKMSGNADGENILWEYGKIVQRPEKKKLMIVLSDGEPADSKYEGDIYTFTRHVIEGIEKSSVGIIGIGIESKAVEHFYKRYRLLKKSSDIESTLLDILKNEVIHA